SGLAEIVKHAIIGSTQLWDLLEGIDHMDQVPWAEVLELNSPVKVKIVESDLTEQGYRKVLNFGHTIGHALESFYLSNDQEVRHGQCVAMGMMVESKIALVTGLLNEIDFEAIMRMLNRFFPVHSTLSPEFRLIRPWLEKDKKQSDSRIPYSLPDQIGSCRWNIQVEDHVAEDCFEWWR